MLEQTWKQKTDLTCIFTVKQYTLKKFLVGGYGEDALGYNPILFSLLTGAWGRGLRNSNAHYSISKPLRHVLLFMVPSPSPAGLFQTFLSAGLPYCRVSHFPAANCYLNQWVLIILYESKYSLNLESKKGRMDEE